jgi:hypothetical protein
VKENMKKKKKKTTRCREKEKKRKENLQKIKEDEGGVLPVMARGGEFDQLSFAEF